MARPPSESEVTPVEVPRPAGDNGAVRGSLKDIEGLPTAVADEDTGPVRRALASAAGNGDGMTAHGVAQALVELMGGPGGQGGGVPPGDHAKSVKRHNWITALVVALLGSGGVVASYYATEARSKENSEAIDRHISEPAHPEADKEIRYIKARIETVGEDMAQVRAQQTTISAGIEELKQEKVNALKEELREIRRENRDLRRRRRRGQ